METEAVRTHMADKSAMEASPDGPVHLLAFQHVHEHHQTQHYQQQQQQHQQAQTQTQGLGEPRRPHVTKLLTLSPEALRVAAEITPHRLANLLIRKGPLAIRLITAQLAIEVPGFDLLSLLKQRRLIMAAMDQGDPENNVVFEKIGWGQWAVRRVDLDYIVTEDGEGLRMNIHELKEKAKLGWAKKEQRRDLILNAKPNLHNVRVPDEKPDGRANSPLSDLDSDDDMETLYDLHDSYPQYSPYKADEETAIAEDLDGDDNVFAFDDEPVRPKRSPPVKFANRVPTKFSPPPALSSRRKSSSAGASVSKNTHTRHQLFLRLRLNLLDNLDNYIMLSARNLQLLVALPPPQPGSVPLALPHGLWSGAGGYLPDAIKNRRKLSFNESSIRLTLALLMHTSPTIPAAARRPPALRQDASDTDEEDWASIGAASLRKHSAGLSSPVRRDAGSDERTAARALVDLMSTELLGS